MKFSIFYKSAQKIKFSFFISDDDDEKLTSFYGKRSLEHIWPKSKYADLPPDALLHSIGNLLFLYANDNSKFNDSFPEDKKQIYFDLREKLRSRCLLHTMSVFAYDNWSCENAQQCIENNQKRVLNLIAEGYKQYV